ncbi:MAG: hypothetical protein ABL931_17425, partial [Usitatibacteraceae bacterium]
MKPGFLHAPSEETLDGAAHANIRTAPTGFSSRGSAVALLAYAVLVLVCVASLVKAGDFSFGRKPWENLVATASELSRPSFFDVWFG